VAHKDVFLRVEQIEKQMIKQDQKIEVLFSYLSKFIEKEEKPRKKVGYEIGKNNQQGLVFSSCELPVMSCEFHKPNAQFYFFVLV
jgi:hypothetical protein